MARESSGRLSAYIEIARPNQWYKNLLLFVGLVFSQKFGQFDLLFLSIMGFAAFCCLSSSIYVFNDIVDRDNDKAHPRKAKRPIPSGEIRIGQAIAYGLVLLVTGIAISLYVGWQFLVLASCYIAISSAYSFITKNIVIMDAICLAVGFVIRAVAGAIAVSVMVSPWLIICVFLLALFLTFGKRRHELETLGEDVGLHREILKDYSVHMTDDMVSISAATLIMSYSMWTFLATDQLMMFTIPFAVYGLLRYMFLMHMAEGGGEPEQAFKDLPSVANILCWGLTVFLVLYILPKLHLVGGG